MKPILTGLAVALSAPAFAQQQVVKPPIAQYWMSVETAAGMGMPGMGGFMAGMMGGQAQGGRRLALQLTSQRASDAPRADHVVPQGMNMGPSLPLVTPRSESRPPERGERERDLPEGMERPRGRMLIYWGCGETTRANQPVIIDFARLGPGQAPPNFASRRIAGATPPSPGRSRTYGDWPNPQDGKPVPDSASLRGEHQVKGTYSPDIRFSLGDNHDFMDRVELVPSLRPSGAALVRWNAVSTATGYFATAVGGEGDDVVMWSSSEQQEMGGALSDYVPPAEVARLVREKIVLSPQTTECAVPAEVIKRAGGSPFLNFIAYGPEANFAQPPRPSDPRQPWEPLWTTKVRFKSTASTLLGEAGESRGSRATRGAPARESREPREDRPAQPAEAPREPTGADAVKEGINILRGIFGR